MLNLSEEYRRGYRNGFADARNDPNLYLTGETTKGIIRDTPRSPKPKRKASAYSKRYGAAFRKLSPKYKLKNGSWGKDGFKRCQKAAHKLARKD